MDFFGENQVKERLVKKLSQVTKLVTVFRKDNELIVAQHAIVDKDGNVLVSEIENVSVVAQKQAELDLERARLDAHIAVNNSAIDAKKLEIDKLKAELLDPPPISEKISLAPDVLSDPIEP